MGREPPVEREASLDESTLAAPEPSIPPQLYLPDWAAQCHKFYSFDSTPVKHSHDFFENGAHDFDVLQEWGVEQSEGTCHRSLTYFLDSDFGVRCLLYLSNRISLNSVYSTQLPAFLSLNGNITSLFFRQSQQSQLLHRRYKLGQREVGRSFSGDARSRL